MSRANDLLSKLKSSLPKPESPSEMQSQRKNVKPALQAHISPRESGPAPHSTMGSLEAAGDRDRQKRVPLCFSVYESDVRRLDEIKDFMRAKGYRNISNSEAVRLACRAVEIGDHFLLVYQEMRLEDGRRR